MMPSRHRMPSYARLLLCATLSCLPFLAQAQALSALRVLPATAPGQSFPGWQSEGAVPSALTVALELGDEVYGATVQLRPTRVGETWRVRVQYETSLGLSAEGPHLDLTDWKHCVSGWEPAEAIDPVTFVLPTPAPEQHECFPAYTPTELDAAVHAYATKSGMSAEQASSWLEGVHHPTPTWAVTPFVAISAVRVKVEALRQGRWVEVTTVTFEPPMGC